MPTYQYACTECGNQLEAVQSFTDEPLSECPACEGRLRKLFNSVGIVFKGSGFYRTDSRSGSDTAKSNGNGKEAKSESSTASGSTASSAGSSNGSNGANGSGSSTAKAPATSGSPSAS